MPTTVTRRSVLLGASGLALGGLTHFDPALAESPTGVLHVAMTASAVPLSNGCPDQGAEGHRFMGITLYDQLVEWDLSSADKPSGLKPGLATEWKTDPANQKRWIYTLRPGVKFHDGKVLEADDVAFSFDRAFKTDAPWFDARASAQVRGRMPTVVLWGSDGPGTFWLETSVVDSTIPYVSTWVGITHRGAWEAAGKNWDAYLNKAVGTGPWKLDSFNLRESAVLLRNPDYWDAARVPKCEKLILLPMPEANTRVAALRAGQVDFVEAPPPDAVPSLKAAGMQIITNTYQHNWTWHLSRVDGSPFNDIRVRKALNLAVDRAGMKELLGGLMEEGTGFVPAANPWRGNPSFKPTYDPDAAKKLLAEAGYSAAKPLSFKVGISTSGSGQMQPLQMNEFLQQNMKDVGVEVSFEVFDWNALLGVWREGAKAPSNRGIAAINITYSLLDPYTTFIRFLKTDLITPKGNNWGYYSDPEMDAMITKVYTTFDPTAQNAVLIAIEEKIVNEALFLFVAHDLNPRALSPKVHGFVQAQSWFQDLTPITMS
jgi:peptide/nickel transport system substrate-binding protein